MTTLRDDPLHPFPIDTLWAIVAFDEKGNEGIVGTVSPAEVPFVTGSPDNAKMFPMIARALVRQHRKPLRIVKFTRTEILETFEP